ncbi:hypothetical protein CDCA_CDCA13G3551 [Cyanidium caldarium]|uniref:Uncharacterized protein n=1 Tax=Cyanidium caldarium TaxID=2771 RepID=A0AAV9IZH4_CYACA|nr:hypothetical protein CDCA_CDCA13G3551 [Cyanidium caldarium]
MARTRPWQQKMTRQRWVWIWLLLGTVAVMGMAMPLQFMLRTGRGEGSSALRGQQRPRPLRVPPRRRGNGRQEVGQEDASSVVSSEFWSAQELEELGQFWHGLDRAACVAEEETGVGFDWARAQGEEALERRQRAWQRFLREAAAAPARSANVQLRGVAISAGGTAYLPSLMVGLHILRRRTGCTLPVEVFFNGPHEAPSAAFREWVTREYGPVRFRDVAAVMAAAGRRWTNGSSSACRLRPSGYGLKIAAALLSSFREVLVLDADAIAVRDPSGLFELGRFRNGSTGGVFWPDFFSALDAQGYVNSELYQVLLTRHGEPDCRPDEVRQSVLHGMRRELRCGVRLRDVRGCDSGVMLLRMEHRSGDESGQAESVYRPVLLALYMSCRSNYFYRFMYGDKDSYRLAAAALGVRTEMTPITLGSVGVVRDSGFQGHAMAQFWPADPPTTGLETAAVPRVLAFVHRNQRKWPAVLPRGTSTFPWRLEWLAWRNVSWARAAEPPPFILTPDHVLTRLIGEDVTQEKVEKALGYNLDADCMELLQKTGGALLQRTNL